MGKQNQAEQLLLKSRHVMHHNTHHWWALGLWHTTDLNPTGPVMITVHSMGLRVYKSFGSMHCLYVHNMSACAAEWRCLADESSASSSAHWALQVQMHGAQSATALLQTAGWQDCAIKMAVNALRLSNSGTTC